MQRALWVEAETWSKRKILDFIFRRKINNAIYSRSCFIVRIILLSWGHDKLLWVKENNWMQQTKQVFWFSPICGDVAYTGVKCLFPNIHKKCAYYWFAKSLVRGDGWCLCRGLHQQTLNRWFVWRQVSEHLGALCEWVLHPLWVCLCY